MEQKITCKFGGSSLANAGQMEKVRSILEDDPARRYVVVSAPGRENGDGEKVTDHLLNIATKGNHFRDQGKDITPKKSFDSVTEKFSRLVNECGIDGSDLLAGLKDDMNSSIDNEKRIDFMASRGEHYHSRLICRYLQKKGMHAKLMLPEDIGLVVSDDFSSARVLPETYDNLKKLGALDGIIIIPGYYGITQGGDVAVFSRGGSDLTGGEVAYAINADMYENWTDTDGIYQVDPRLVSEAKVIPRLTYKEIRLLSSKGFDVFHFDAMINCKKRNIPINIRNTNNPSAPGTLIVSERVPEETAVGIARLDDVAYIYLEKDGLGEVIGATKDILNILKDHNVQTYHYPTDKDDLAVLVDQNDIVSNVNIIREEIEQAMDPDVLEVFYNLSVLSPVGIGMKQNPGILAQAAAALKNEHINIEIVDQGPGQISFHFGIQSYYADAALKALYRSLIADRSAVAN
ncbi:MAG TPA: aspartate kinase [Deltaproteobacteria bacterium]|nr:aspartate kinase [Deltaproteobacteria bacterium]